MTADEDEIPGEVDGMKNIIQSGETTESEDEEPVERENGSEGGFVDELSDGSEALEVVDGDPIGSEDSTGGREPPPSEEPDSSGGKPSTPTKSDVLGFIRATEDIEEGNIYVPGEHWADSPPARYVDLELVLRDGRLTRPGACMLCYASDLMSESPSPEAEIVARLNTDGVNRFAGTAFEIDPEEAKIEEGLDGLLS